jgi:hypothetical protein
VQRSFRPRARRVTLALATVVCCVAGLLGGAGPASADSFGPYPAKVAIDGRGSMNVDDRVKTDAYLAGQNVYLRCQDVGQPVNGNAVWGYTVQNYWVPDTYLTTGVNGLLPGIPRCRDIGVSGGNFFGDAGPFLAKVAIDGRAAMSDSYRVKTDAYLAGDQIWLQCQDSGPSVGGSTIWDFTEHGYWIPDAYVSTGTSGFVPGVPRCTNIGINGNVTTGGEGKFLAKTTLNGYNGKSLSATKVVDKYPGGSYITVVCQAFGEQNYGGSRIWDKTSDGLWVPDYYVKTGSSSIILNRCDTAGPSDGSSNGAGFLAKTTLNGYNGKSLSATKVVDKYPGGSYVTIVCQAYGELNYGGSYVWDRTTDGLWVPDYYIQTGASDIILQRCDNDGPVGGSSSGAESPPAVGSVAAAEVRNKIVSSAQSKVGLAEWGDNCNPFGLFGVKCGDPWCSMFASWTWRMAGINTYYPYSGDFYYWGKNRGQLRSFNHVQRGDVVLYGSGPSSSQHIGVVETVHADGRITTIEGNYGNKVTRVGPFDPENPQPQHTYSNIFAIVAPINDALPTPDAPAKHHLYTFDFPVTYADAAIRLPVKTNWSMASKELHRDFNDSFPIGGAPNAFPAEGQTIPLRACVLAVCKDAPVKYYGDSSGYHFDTLPGHFDGEGSTVAFRFYTDSNGWLRLEVKGWVTDPDLPDWLNKAGAYTQWVKFAAKLGDNLHKYQKCDTNGCG